MYVLYFSFFYLVFFFFFFFNDTATTEIYTLSLHDALPIFPHQPFRPVRAPPGLAPPDRPALYHAAFPHSGTDRKSTRLNSSHSQISYAVFCLKKKKKPHNTIANTKNLQNSNIAYQTSVTST